jgi:hypothetical protein
MTELHRITARIVRSNHGFVTSLNSLLRNSEVGLNTKSDLKPSANLKFCLSVSSSVTVAPIILSPACWLVPAARRFVSIIAFITDPLATLVNLAMAFLPAVGDAKTPGILLLLIFMDADILLLVMDADSFLLLPSIEDRTSLLTSFSFVLAALNDADAIVVVF